MSDTPVSERPRPLDRFFFRGYTPESLGWLRIWLAIWVTFFVWDQFTSLHSVDLFGPTFYYYTPIWYFSLLGIERHIPIVTFVALGLLIAGGVALLLGYRTRAALVTLLLCMLYLKGVRDSQAGAFHHRLLIPFHMLFLLLLSRAGDVLSLDAGRRSLKRRVEAWEASWPIRAMQVYITLFYSLAGVAKVRATGIEWFDGQYIQRLMLRKSGGAEVLESGEWSFKVLSWELSQSPEICALIGAATFVFEFGFPIILFVNKQWIRVAIVLGTTFFHVANYLLAGVKFLYMPFVLVVFFDLRPVGEWIVAHLPRPLTRLVTTGRGG